MGQYIQYEHLAFISFIPAFLPHYHHILMVR